MPPRLPTPISISTSITHRTFTSFTPLRLPPTDSDSSITVSTRWEDRKEVKDMLDWIHLRGKDYKRPLEQGGTNYLTDKQQGNEMSEGENDGPSAEDGAAFDNSSSPVDGAKGLLQRFNATKSLKSKPKKPFRWNETFFSMPVLSEGLKEHIYTFVTLDGHPIKKASEHFGVSIDRIGAVVRMKQIERNWVQEGKRVVPRYNEQVLRMLPQTADSRETSNGNTWHEHINELPVHPATSQQIFWPTSESRQFTREDAGNVFRKGLKPADVRIPHPEMVLKAGLEATATRSLRMQVEQEMERDKGRSFQQKTKVKTVDAGRWSFKIEDVDIAERVGPDGRGRRGVGYRYGMPLDDRKRAMVKIPTSVP